jgi:hypothetical protein
VTQPGHVNDRASNSIYLFVLDLHPVFFLDRRIARRQLGNVAHLTNFIILLVETPWAEKSPKIRRLFDPFSELASLPLFRDTIFGR